VTAAIGVAMRHAVPRTQAWVRRFRAEVETVAIGSSNRPATLETGQLHHSGTRPESAFERRRGCPCSQGQFLDSGEFCRAWTADAAVRGPDAQTVRHHTASLDATHALASRQRTRISGRISGSVPASTRNPLFNASFA